MNKYQIISIWVVVILAIIMLGLETKIVSGDPAKYHLNCLYFYGLETIRYDTPLFGYLVNIGYYKYQLFIAVILIGYALNITLGKIRKPIKK